MRKPILTLICCVLVVGLYAQKSTAILLSYDQVNNHYRFHEVFNVAADPNEIMIFPKADYLGLAIRHRTKNNHIYSASISGNYLHRPSVKVNVPYEELNMPSYDIRSGGAMLRLEYSRLWSIPKHKPLRIGYATALGTRLTYNDFSSRVFDRFPASFMSFETLIGIGPQFSYSINDRLLANFKLPIDVFNHFFLQSRLENPNLPQSMEISTGHTLYALLLRPAFSFSVGYFIFHENRKSNNNTF